jgi:hypothetical protein
VTLIDKILALHRSLRDAGIPHAFGGALALAWCTQQARGTIDIDLNLFVDLDGIGEVLDQLPEGVAWSADDLALLQRDGQARLWWDATPVDLFFNTTEFHARLAGRARLEPFEGEQVPFLACRDLAVFKAFFNRTKDWADLEAMAEAGSLDVQAVLGVLAAYLGPDDDRLDRLRALGPPAN